MYKDRMHESKEKAKATVVLVGALSFLAVMAMVGWIAVALVVAAGQGGW